MTTDTSLAASKLLMKKHLETHLRENISNLKKPQVDKILHFVTSYFGQDMHGQTDKAEFRALVKEVSSSIQQGGTSE